VNSPPPEAGAGAGDALALFADLSNPNSTLPCGAGDGCADELLATDV
jgi:hypothetical protein